MTQCFDTLDWSVSPYWENVSFSHVDYTDLDLDPYNQDFGQHFPSIYKLTSSLVRFYTPNIKRNTQGEQWTSVQILLQSTVFLLMFRMCLKEHPPHQLKGCFLFKKWKFSFGARMRNHITRLCGKIPKLLQYHQTMHYYHQRHFLEAWLNSTHTPFNCDDDGLLPEAYWHLVNRWCPHNDHPSNDDIRLECQTVAALHRRPGGSHGPHKNSVCLPKNTDNFICGTYSIRVMMYPGCQRLYCFAHNTRASGIQGR